ncbi:tetratricopeptide repeat protein [Duganella sp. FT92W]|uniref:Tetratricopeptide repeat protein n=1 Tax=Pseudoduganella rivuli TaxID=2666085 RepID=A0A7X2IM95_9BURK|nr:protein-glutamate O-methyltransferase CheR [Pseudoduganella rivuli]MRV72459.1 tetratricopeptide repeat protein [Pseudoduganella rivuli]
MSVQAMIRHATGLNVSRAQAERAIRQRMERTGEVNREHYLTALSPGELAELVELLVVPESWMFRDPQAFEAAVDYVQARLADGQRTVRILSVPCAGGEEPYSIAMALFDTGVAPTNFAIDALDLSSACVERARAGVYGRNAFRNKDLSFRDRYFEALGNDLYRVADTVRAQVRFNQGNLLAMDTAAFAGYYDVIFCRNLLIYFDKPTTANAIARLSAMLDDDGVLFAGYAEVPTFTQHGFTPLPHRFAFALKKDTAPAPRYATMPRPGDALPARTLPERRAVPRPAHAAPAIPLPGRPAVVPPPPPARSAKAAVPPVPPPAQAGAISNARALADRGQHQQAAAACQSVLAADPQSPAAAEAYFILGMLREQAQDAREAEQFWRRCIYLQPDHYEALCHLALLAEQQGEPDAAATLKARARRIYQRNNATKADL